MQHPDAATIEELRRIHSGQWLALRVTERDPMGRPRRAELLAHAEDRSDLYASVEGQPDLCIVYAGDVIPEGYGAIL